MEDKELMFAPISIIDQHISQVSEERTEERTLHRYWPSQASISYTNEKGEKQIVGKCARAVYYQIMGERESNPMDARSRRIVTMGKMVEQQEIEWSKKAGIYDSSNVKFEHSIPGGITVAGEVDAFYRSPKTDKVVGIEYKTGYGYQFHAEVFGNTRHTGVPKKEHLLQVMLYLEHFSDIPYFLIVYIDRGDMTHVSHKVALCRSSDPTKCIALVNDKAFELFSISRIHKRFQELDVCITQKTIPNREFELFYSDEKVEKLWKSGDLSEKKYKDHKKGKRAGHWACRYCQFMKTCYRLSAADADLSGEE